MLGSRTSRRRTVLLSAALVAVLGAGVSGAALAFRDDAAPAAVAAVDCDTPEHRFKAVCDPVGRIGDEAASRSTSRDSQPTPSASPTPDPSPEAEDAADPADGAATDDTATDDEDAAPASPGATAEPSPSVSPTPTPSRTATPSPEPSPTSPPKATTPPEPKPSPTRKPEPTPTPEPTRKPRPTPTPTPSPEPAPAPSREQEVVGHLYRLLDASRAEAGLSALQRHDDVAAVAQAWSRHLADTGKRLAHNPSYAEQIPKGWRAAGENVAWISEGGRGTPEEIAKRMHQGWMDSPGHRANILSTSYTHVGIGVAFSAEHGYYLTQVFARY